MMKSISNVLAAALVVGGAIAAAPAYDAAAQTTVMGDAGARRLNISQHARPALVALERAVKARDAAAFATALPTAVAAATNPDEKFFVAMLRYRFARETNDKAGQIAALNALVASGGAQSDQLAAAHATLGTAAYQESAWQIAHDNFAKVLELRPTDSETRFNLALSKLKLRQDADALVTIKQAIAGSRAANKPVPEPWLRLALKIAFDNRKPEALALSREVLAAYPNQDNWRNVLVVQRDALRADQAAAIDVLRLMRASKAMTAKNEYYDLALLLTDQGLPGEAKKVMDEGLAANLARTTDDNYRKVAAFTSAKLTADQASLGGLEIRAMAATTGQLAFRTADALLGYGEYAKAAALYRAALSKGADIDVSLTYMHLGIALGFLGDKAGAEAAFKAVTGPRAEVAALWVAWLNRKA